MNIFKLFGSVFVDTEKANESLSKTDKKASSVGTTLLKGVKSAGKFAIGLGGACAAGATALVGVAKSAAGTTDNIDKMSQKIGISRQAYQELDFICSQSGASVDNLKAGMKTLTNQMQMASQGSKTAKSAFNELGLSWTDSAGKLKNQETMMWEAFSALQKMEDQTKKSALATDLFGKAGTELMPMLNGSTESIEEMKKKAHDLGLVLSDDAVDAGVKLTDTMDQAKRSFDAVIAKIGVSVMPLVQNLLEWVLNHMPQIQNVLSSTFKVIEVIVNTFGEVFSNVFSSIDNTIKGTEITFGTVFEAIKEVIRIAFEFIQGVWETVGKPIFDFFAMAIDLVYQQVAQMMPQIKEFVASAFTDIQAFWENNLKPCFQAIGDFIQNVLAPVFQFVFKNVIVPHIQSAFKMIQDLWNNFLKPVFTGITDFITGIFTLNFKKAFSGIVSAVQGIFGGIVSVVKAPLNTVIGIVNKFIGGLNKIKVPSWIPGIGGKGINIPNIPLLAKGGRVYEGGQAIVGEAGAELIDLPAGAKVSPLTNNSSNLIGAKEMLPVLHLILEELKLLNRTLYDKVVQALLNGVRINWNDRELARLVRKYV